MNLPARNAEDGCCAFGKISGSATVLFCNNDMVELMTKRVYIF